MTDIYEANNFDPQNNVGGLIGQVRSAFFSALGEALTPFDITPPQYITIVKLAGGVYARPAEICKLMQYDPGAMTRIIDQLEKRKLVKRVSDPDDRRAIKLELTAQGKALYPKLTETAAGVFNHFLRGFTKTEVRQMEDLLKRVIVNAQQKSSEL